MKVVRDWSDVVVEIVVWIIMAVIVFGIVLLLTGTFGDFVDALGGNYEWPLDEKYDVNLDGQVDNMDARLVYEVINSGNIPTPDLMNRCDIDGDGFITESDAFTIHKMVFPEEEEKK